MFVGTIILLATCTTGCFRRYANGWMSPPGTIQDQRSQAVVHDPFPDNTAGPSLFNRPWGYQNPHSQQRRLDESPYSNYARQR